MKKTISIFLAVCLLLSLAACGAAPSGSSGENPSAPAVSDTGPVESEQEDLEPGATQAEKEEMPSSVLAGNEAQGPADEPAANTSQPSTSTPASDSQGQTPTPPQSSQAPTAAPASQAPAPQSPAPMPTAPQAPMQSQTPRPSQPTPTPTPTPTQSPQEPEQKILIAYFTWADNTSVEDPSSVDPTIDAPSSASILPPGDTARLAGWIQQEVGGDLHSIITEEPYSSDYDDCLDRAIDEQDRGIRPALSSSVSNMDDYDIVFLGYPNWWYSCPMAILTFIEENDLSGKTIIPFCAHGTGGLASSLRDIKAALPSDCTVLKEFDVYRADVRSAQSDVQAWLRDLDL